MVYGDNTLEITGYGDMDNWSSVTAVPWSDYRFDIVGVRFNLSGNTTIGSYAFSDLVKEYHSRLENHKSRVRCFLRIRTENNNDSESEPEYSG